MDRYILRWELWGAIFIILLGSLFHFTFEWSGYYRPIAIIAAVNESVWEHLKLAFWPGLFWAILEANKFQTTALKFWSVKGYGLLVAPGLIIVVFYSYTALLGRNVLIVDIVTFIIAIVLGQIVTAKLLSAKSIHFLARVVGLVLLLCQLGMYSTFTFYPPPYAFFEDSRDGTIGIPNASILP